MALSEHDGIKENGIKDNAKMPTLSTGYDQPRAIS